MLTHATFMILMASAILVNHSLTHPKTCQRSDPDSANCFQTGDLVLVSVAFGRRCQSTTFHGAMQGRRSGFKSGGGGTRDQFIYIII